MPEVVRVPRIFRRRLQRTAIGVRRIAIISKQRLAERERSPGAFVVGSHLEYVSSVERRAPRIAFDQELRELAMGECGVVARFGSRACESTKKRKNVGGIERALERPLDVLTKPFGFGLPRPLPRHPV